MNPRAARSFDRLQRTLDRRQQSANGRVSTAPLVLILGLILADVLLAYLVPWIWDSLLPHGFEQAETFAGVPALIWRGALYAQEYQRVVRCVIVALLPATALACLLAKPIRFAVQLSAIGVVLVNAGILIVAIEAGLRATAAAAGFSFY